MKNTLFDYSTEKGAMSNAQVYNESGITVLSLFDGIACGMQALKELGVCVDKYYASEVDKYAIDVALKNHSDIVELGDITNWREWAIDWSSIDLLIGGPPCQGFSSCGKRLNFYDERSGLIRCYFDILEHLRNTNPNVKFLMENVKMRKSWKAAIDSYMGVEGVHINSNLFSAPNRDRIYWTNLRISELTIGNEDVLQDVIEEVADNDSKLYLTKKHLDGFLRNYKWKPNLLTEKSKPILASYFKRPPHCPYVPHNKELGSDTPYSEFRMLSPNECEKLQALPIGYTAEGASGKKISDCQRYKVLGNGWTVSVIKHLFGELKREAVFEELLSAA